MPRNAATQNNNTENMEQQVPFKIRAFPMRDL